MFLLIATEAVLKAGLDDKAGDYRALDEFLDEEFKCEHCDSDDNYGEFIRVFMGWLADCIRCEPNYTRFRFGDPDYLTQDSMDEIGDEALRRRVITFVNDHFVPWRDDHIVIVTRDACEDGVRESSLCQRCDTGWKEEFEEYEGPTADDVSDKEDPTLPHLTAEAVQAIIIRNDLRQQRREEYEQAQADCESNPVDREFICEENCDEFYERCDRRSSERSEYPTSWLDERWRETRVDSVRNLLPPLLNSFGLHEHGEVAGNQFGFMMSTPRGVSVIDEMLRDYWGRPAPVQGRLQVFGIDYGREINEMDVEILAGIAGLPIREVVDNVIVNADAIARVDFER